MATGDFVFAGPNDTSYSNDDFRMGRHEFDKKIAGITLLFLFVTIKLTRKETASSGQTGQPGAGQDSRASTTQHDTVDTCVCTAKITDYSLQGNVYVDKNVPAGDKRLGVTIHELIHLWHHQQSWENHKKELESLLDGKNYSCSDEAKTLIVQDIFAWMTRTFYSDQHTEEEHTQILEQAFERSIKEGTSEKQAIEDIFGKEKLDAHAKEAKPDKDLPLADRFSSRVIPTWDGSCAR